MKYVEFDQTRPMDLILLGRVAIDFNPAYNDQVKEEFNTSQDVQTARSSDLHLPRCSQKKKAIS